MHLVLRWLLVSEFFLRPVPTPVTKFVFTVYTAFVISSTSATMPSPASSAPVTIALAPALLSSLA